MSHHAESSPEHGSDRLIWRISLVSATLSLVCGLTAYCVSERTHGPAVDYLYRALHLLELHMPEEDLKDEAGLALALFYTARFLAVAAFAATGVAVVFRVLGREIRQWNTVRRGGHAVVCGLGRVGRELVSQMRADNVEVVAIDHGEDAAAVNGALEAGASVMAGNPVDGRFLKRAGVAKAKYLFAGSDDDTVNISAGLQAAGLIVKPAVAVPGKALHVYVHVEEPQLRSELHKKHMVPESHEHLHMAVFSAYENSARLLLKEHPLDRARLERDDPRMVQLVLIGFGFMGESILVRAAMAGHYANLKRLKAVVVDRGAARAERIFRARYGRFADVADAEFLELDPEEPATQDRVAELCGDPEATLSTVVVTLDQPTRALSVALSLAGRLHCSVPVRYRLDEDAGIGELMERRRAGNVDLCPITPFGTIAAACRAEHWANRMLDAMARALHEDYVRKLDESDRVATNPSAAPWDQLSEQLRESNRQAADHIPVKLRALGCHEAKAGSGDPGVLVTEFTEEEVDLLSRMEQRRWMAERFLAGWTLGPKDTQRRISPWLVDLDQLPPHIKELDRNAVRVIPGVLAGVGIEIRR